MWRRLKNFSASLSTYADLSPDMRVRRRVKKLLHDRSDLSAEVWFEKFWFSLEVAKPVADFVYVYLQKYSGLAVGRIQPDDRLVEDLRLPLICWFDWEITLCEDFCCCFGVDLSDRFQTQKFITVKDLVTFLNRQLLSVNHFQA
jgi:hypothetical protein